VTWSVGSWRAEGRNDDRIPAASLRDVVSGRPDYKEAKMAPEVGEEAPDFTLRDESNQKWTLSEHRGRNILLVFYPLSFSGVCTYELHEITNRSEKFDTAGAEVVGISVDSKYVQNAFKERS
jgi:peroxiredoxin